MVEVLAELHGTRAAMASAGLAGLIAALGLFVALPYHRLSIQSTIHSEHDPHSGDI